MTTADRRHRERLRWHTQGRADALVTIARWLTTEQTHQAADELNLDPDDINRARTRRNHHAQETR